MRMETRWFNFPEEAATLEPEGNIPKFIVEYYRDKSKIGMGSVYTINKLLLL